MGAWLCGCTEHDGAGPPFQLAAKRAAGETPASTHPKQHLWLEGGPCRAAQQLCSHIDHRQDLCWQWMKYPPREGAAEPCQRVPWQSTCTEAPSGGTAPPASAGPAGHPGRCLGCASPKCYKRFTASKRLLQLSQQKQCLPGANTTSLGGMPSFVSVQHYRGAVGRARGCCSRLTAARLVNGQPPAAQPQIPPARQGPGPSPSGGTPPFPADKQEARKH
jgi:hypothetical protein